MSNKNKAYKFISKYDYDELYKYSKVDNNTMYFVSEGYPAKNILLKQLRSNEYAIALAACEALIKYYNYNTNDEIFLHIGGSY